MNFGRKIFALLFLFLGLSFGIVQAEENPVGLLYPLTISKQNGDEITLQVEIARTPIQMKRGLMHRKSMPENQGMIFLHNQPRVLRMWMKNTLIPLDMVFIDLSATVHYIHSFAVPHDETVISAPKPSVAVLELNAGVTEKLGLSIGDKIRLSTAS